MELNSLSDLMQCEIVRGEKAEIIVDYVDNQPVRLIGFECSTDLTDFEIYEEGWNYYYLLTKLLENGKY